MQLLYSKNRVFRTAFGAVFILIICVAGSCDSPADSIGATLLSQVTTNVNGAGVPVAQAEAGEASSSNWQVNPGAVAQSPALFTYFSSSGSSSSFPNAFGFESGHADAVGSIFYGIPGGLATNVSHIDNYEASYFALTVVPTLAPINDSVVNQSFVLAAPLLQNSRPSIRPTITTPSNIELYS